MGAQSPCPSGLKTLNATLLFMLLLVLAVLLSLESLLRQRRLLRDPAAGGEEGIFPLRLGSGAISLGALGFFFTLALAGWQEACQSGSAVEKKLSQVNLWASLLALAAAILRLWALDAGWRITLPEEEEELPA